MEAQDNNVTSLHYNNNDTFSSSSSQQQQQHSLPYNPLHIPFREWELGPNNTIWDNQRAAPSDEDILWQWGLLTCLSVVALIGIAIVFFAILNDRTCRQNAFNLYILSLMVPDLLFTLLGLMTLSLNLANGSFYNLAHCHFQSYYSVFTVSASSWLNAILAKQLHNMLRASNAHQRYKPPTRRKALRHGLFVFLWSAFVASWAVIPIEGWPIRTELYSGAFCLPMAYDEPSTAFFFLVFGPCCFGLPFLYICYVVIHIMVKNLLPPKEKRKRLLIFFGLIVTYFFIWVPTIVLTYILGYWMKSWYTFFGAVWGVSQGFISAAVCLLKADIQRACRKFVGMKEQESNNNSRTSGGTGRGGARSHLSESYIHTTNFSLDANSIHSVSSSVVDLSSLRDNNRDTRGGRFSGGNNNNNRTYSQRSISSSSISFVRSLSLSGRTSDGIFQSHRSEDPTITEVDEDNLSSSLRNGSDHHHHSSSFISNPKVVGSSFRGSFHKSASAKGLMAAKALQDAIHAIQEDKEASRKSTMNAGRYDDNQDHEDDDDDCVKSEITLTDMDLDGRSLEEIGEIEAMEKGDTKSTNSYSSSSSASSFANAPDEIIITQEEEEQDKDYSAILNDEMDLDAMQPHNNNNFFGSPRRSITMAGRVICSSEDGSQEFVAMADLNDRQDSCATLDALDDVDEKKHNVNAMEEGKSNHSTKSGASNKDNSA